ncbi:MAG: Fe-S cluster assembly ATPase SufC [Bacteroidetes bacterium QS_8_64_10]|nr:MAG: Fe-S cluster assembly ATPase SufC [Bacteroidetes bacterium QS_8_64_10]
MALLEINDLHVSVEDSEILRGVDLTIDTGQTHAIMGPNGSGKSTLAKVLAGREEYEVDRGSVLFEGEDILGDEPDERAEKGIFLAFQYPVELPGVSMNNFLKESVNKVREARGEEPLGAADLLQQIREKAELVGLNADLTKRSVNEGFSGGEKKRNEIFQLAMLEPKLAIMDETDSGLDIDALRAVADGVNKLRTDDRGFMVITHYQRLLNYIVPDRVHVMIDGRIVRSGGKELAVELEDKGYEWVREDAAVAA